MLAFAFTCDKEEKVAVAVSEELKDFHDPATSFSMRIDLLG